MLGLKKVQIRESFWAKVWEKVGTILGIADGSDEIVYVEFSGIFVQSRKEA